MIKSLSVQHAHAAVAKINNFFNVSPKRVELLKRIIQIRSGPNHKQKRARLITLCVTRFTERHLSVKLLRELLPFVVLAVEQLMTWQSLETKKEALNIECLIKNVRFIVGLLMLEYITAVLKPATESLQGKQVDLGCCMTTITLMKQQLQEMNVDYWHNFLFPKIIKLGEELNVDIAKPRQAGGGNQPESVSEYYGKVWRSALQNVIDDLNLKFGPNQQHVILLQHLIPGFVPAAPVTDEEVAKVLLTNYQSLCPSTSPMELEREINRWRHRWADIDDKLLATISALSNTESFPNIWNFLLLFVTLPITSCEPEKFFSKVQRTKTAIRSTMGTERLEALVIITAHRSTLPSQQDIINVLQGIYYLNNELKRIKILAYFKFTYFLLFILIIIFTLQKPKCLFLQSVRFCIKTDYNICLSLLMLMTVPVDSYPVNELSALVNLLRVYLGWNLEDNLLLILNKMR